MKRVNIYICNRDMKKDLLYKIAITLEPESDDAD